MGTSKTWWFITSLLLKRVFSFLRKLEEESFILLWLIAFQTKVTCMWHRQVMMLMMMVYLFSDFISKHDAEHIRGSECDQKILSKKESTGFVYHPNYPFPYIQKVVCRWVFCLIRCKLAVKPDRTLDTRFWQNFGTAEWCFNSFSPSVTCRYWDNAPKYLSMSNQNPVRSV